MEISELITFFDKAASDWDKDMIIDEDIVKVILSSSTIGKGKTVLDVACGTGVLIPFYLEYNSEHITAVDISPKMIDIAKSKFACDKVSFYCSDIESFNTNVKFDSIFVYNALPHFISYKALIDRLVSLVNIGGSIVIAHGMSREKINRHHSGKSAIVSHELPAAKVIADLFPSKMKISKIIDNEKMYLISAYLDQ